MAKTSRFRHAVEHGLSHARASKCWVVLVCPTSGAAASCRRTLVGLTLPADSFGGRTVALDGGGRVSVVDVDSSFRPEVPFRVQFIGWKTTHPIRKMTAWRETAETTLQSE